MADFRLFDPVGDAVSGSTGIQGNTGIQGTAGVQGVTGISAGGGGFFTDGAGDNAAIGKGDVAPTAAGENAFAQGDNCEATGDNSFAQGDQAEAVGFSSFSQGYDVYTEEYHSFSQGYNIDNYGRQNFAQGRYQFITDSGPNNMLQGNTNYLSYGYHSFVQGQGNNVSGSSGTEIYGTFTQGLNNTNTFSSYSFVQGRSNLVNGARSFAQGAFAQTFQSDQKSWGSNRTVTAGAQKCHVIKYVNTINSTPVTIASIPTLSDKSYSIQCNVVARNTDTNGESASYVLLQAGAYNDTGTAVLNGSPSFVIDDSGGGAAGWSVAIAVSGTSINIDVTGDATDSVQWCCDLSYVEVRG